MNISPVPTDADAYNQVRVAGLWPRIGMAFLLIYCIALLAMLVPVDVFSPVSHFFILSIAAIGIWRYSWWGLQAARAFFYTRVRFPEYRRAATAVGNHKPDHIYALVTSYKMAPKVTWQVYQSLLQEVTDYGRPATIVASITDQSDLRLLKKVMRAVNPPDRVELVVMFQDGTGKRPAMAEALRAISRRMPSRNAVCIFMDGDCRLTRGTLHKSLPFFHLLPDVGAVTVDNRGITAGGNWAREWYDLRFAQRHLVMSSLSLSRRLLVLTGRFSVFRAHLATDRSFIDQLENDHIDHWRFGRFKFLSGDDKTTWYWLMKNGWRMLYVPDARVDSFEELPGPTLLFGAVPLMKRWFGNMLRANGRAIRLGPRRVGGFVWWSLLDQRMSIWTALVGPAAAVMLSVMYRPSFMLVYALWVLITRIILSLGLGLHAKRYSPYWPFLLYFNQIVGAWVKTHVSFRLNQQSWTRQKISVGSTGSQWRDAAQRIGNATIHGTAMACFLIGVLFYTGVLSLPSSAAIESAMSRGILAGDALADAGPGRHLADAAPVGRGATPQL